MSDIGLYDISYLLQDFQIYGAKKSEQSSQRIKKRWTLLSQKISDGMELERIIDAREVVMGITLTVPWRQIIREVTQ